MKFKLYNFTLLVFILQYGLTLYRLPKYLNSYICNNVIDFCPYTDIYYICIYAYSSEHYVIIATKHHNFE